MSHHDVTVEQFTMQAPDFAAAPAMHDADAPQALLDAAQPCSADTVLDVACGPGILVAAIAPQVTRVVGIDLAPAMIELARERCRELGLENTELQIGDVDPLPYADATFSLVLCRYALHHFQAPGSVIAQMARVCAPGGRVVVADIAASDDPAIAARLDRVERARPVPSPCADSGGRAGVDARCRSHAEACGLLPAADGARRAARALRLAAPARGARAVRGGDRGRAARAGGGAGRRGGALRLSDCGCCWRAEHARPRHIGRRSGFESLPPSTSSAECAAGETVRLWSRRSKEGARIVGLTFAGALRRKSSGSSGSGDVGYLCHALRCDPSGLDSRRTANAANAEQVSPRSGKGREYPAWEERMLANPTQVLKDAGQWPQGGNKIDPSVSNHPKHTLAVNNR